MARRSALPDARQFNLLDCYFEAAAPTGPLPGSLDIEAEWRGALNKAIKECPDDREVIAARMNGLVGAGDEEPRVTKAMLDAWTAQSRTQWRFPVIYLPAFVVATGAHWLLDMLAQKVGCRTLIGEAALFADLAKIESMKTDLKRREQAIRRQLKGRRS